MSDGRRDFEGRGKEWAPLLVSYEGVPVLTPALDMKAVRIDYTNWKGNRGWRIIVPMEITFSSSMWHPEFQWVLKAYDLEEKAERFFAMKYIHVWEAAG